MSTSNQPLRFGVLGIGRMGIRHALNVRRSEYGTFVLFTVASTGRK